MHRPSELHPPTPARRLGITQVGRLAPLGRRDLLWAVAVALVAMLVYNANLRPIATGDSRPARFLPFALLTEGSLALDRFVDVAIGGYPQPYWLLPDRQGDVASLYPIVTPVLITPLYVPATIYLNQVGWDDRRLERIGMLLEKLSASLIAAVSAALLFLALRRRLGFELSLLLAAAFAFATNTWVTSSQALWQHGLSELLLAFLLLVMTGPSSRWRVVAAGVAFGLVFGNRPPDILLAVPFAAYAPFWCGWRRSVAFLAGAAVPLLLVVAYNLHGFGHLTGGYGVIAMDGSFLRPTLTDVTGLLVSPGKGLFVFAPFLLFVPLLPHRVLRPLETRWLTLLLIAGMLLQLTLYASMDWRGGYSFGPRFLTGWLPLLVWMLAPVVASLGALLRGLFLTLCLVGLVIQGIGAFYYQGTSDVELMAGWTAVWDPRKAPYVVELGNGPAAMTFLELAGLTREQSHPGYWLRRWGLR